MRKIFLFIIVLFCTISLQAQDNTSFNFSFNHVSLSVKDLDSTCDFYKNTLGLQEITNRTKKEGIRWFSLGEGKELHLISTVKEPVTINKAIHLGLTTPNFDSFVNKLDKLKIKYNDWEGNLNKITIRADGIKQIYLQDPNGYWIEVNSVAQK
ncbi:catechol 2,3-dioxygenase-like lactoylglutathione lyase family enzyme [Flavobacterium sp. 103]|uniref:VOC family protein n=1 Tax=Flavobacterium sp. 103 TaxID=2135624 RepID=UPI000D5D7130|nr:VOC family protein [Flavobacterium sp. 103]PVX45112.1 catechol 2,3-dioxygenase-like lactoylglutathione lyase family enzyme [Flavobacterium sp. 103]